MEEENYGVSCDWKSSGKTVAELYAGVVENQSSYESVIDKFVQEHRLQNTRERELTEDKRQECAPALGRCSWCAPRHVDTPRVNPAEPLFWQSAGRKL